MPAPAGGSARPEAPAARSADALLGFAPPGAHAAALMPFSGEERSLQGIYKPAAPAEGRAGGGAAVCSECYTNRTFVYDDGSAHRYGYGAGGAPPEGKGREGKERKVREGPGRPRRDPPCTEGPRAIPRHKVSAGNSAPEHPGGWRSAAWPSAEAVVKPEERAVHTRGKLARCRAWHVPTRAPRWVGSVPKLRCLGQGSGCGQSCSVGSQQTMPSLRAQHPSNRGCVAAGEPRLFLTAP